MLEEYDWTAFSVVSTRHHGYQDFLSVVEGLTDGSFIGWEKKSVVILNVTDDPGGSRTRRLLKENEAQILCVSVYNSDSLLPSLIQSPFLSVTLCLPLPLLPPLCHSHSLPNSLEVYWHTGRIVLPSHYSSKFNEGAILKMCFQSVSLTPLLHERIVFYFFFCPSIPLCLFSFTQSFCMYFFYFKCF